MRDISWNDAAIRAARAKRLWQRGFECIDNLDDPATEQLRYAEYEFQLYSLGARWLAQRAGDVVARAQSQQVNADLRALTAGLKLGEAWSDAWEKCLERWEGTREGGDPDPDGAYVCPVLIDRTVTRYETPPDLATQPGAMDRTNVWSLSAKDRGAYFFVRDLSGMFAPDGHDPAYAPNPEHALPADIFDDKWLFTPRSFMQVLPFGDIEGVKVQPWRVCEMLPAVLGRDAARIRADRQWRSLFRVVRGVSTIECSGFFDLLQGYDVVNLSVPLFHYTLSSPKGGNQALTAELGGLLVWLERFDPAVAAAVAGAGLTSYKSDPGRKNSDRRYQEKSWADDRQWGANYDAGSGEGCADAGRVFGAVSIGRGANDSKDDMAFLRRPHFHYRMTMLMRTRAALRIAVWKLALHRLRNLAWMPLPLPKDFQGWPEGRDAGTRIGDILTSELSMAVVLRLHVFSPGKVRSVVGPAIVRFWNEAVAAHPHGKAVDIQNDFEYRFCRHFFGELLAAEPGEKIDPALLADPKAVKGSGLRKLAVWPFDSMGTFGTFGMRLRQTHLEGTGVGVDADPEPPRLSWQACTSPFWATDAQGEAVFADPVDGLDRNPDFSGDGHPAVAARYPKIAATDDFPAFGTAVELPEQFGTVDVLPQRVRETLAIRTAKFVLAAGQLVKNPAPLMRRVHGDGSQYWARRTFAEMKPAQLASALRFSASTNAPAPADSLWQLDATPGSAATVYAFDWRDGVQAPARACARIAVDGRIASEGDAFNLTEGNFGIFLGPLQQKTFAAFALAFEAGTGMDHVDQFRVRATAKGWELVLAGMRQAFPYAAQAPAAPSDWGLLIEYLAWRHGERSPGADGWHGGPFDVMRDLGFDAWVPEPRQADPAFLRQQWPAAARGAKQGAPARPLDSLVLQSAPHLWNAPHPLAPTPNGQLASAMLTWPSLYRMRKLFQVSPEARRAVYDVWRMGMRAALSLPLRMLSPVFGKELPLAFQAFQSREAVAVLACWRYLDSAQLATALSSSSGNIGKKAIAWFNAVPARKQLRDWSDADEHAFLWDVVVGAMAAGPDSVRSKLERMRPLQPPARAYRDQLNEVIDLEDLDSTAPPIPQVDYQAVLLGQPAAGVGLGLLASPRPAPAAMHMDLAAAGTGADFWVSALVPVLNVGGALKAVPLTLPEPVLVRLSQDAAGTASVGMFWSREQAEQPQDFSTLDLSEPFTIEADVSSWLGELADHISLTLLAVASAPAPGELALSLGLRLSSPWLHKPLEWMRGLADIRGITLDPVAGGKQLVWRLDLAELGDLSALPVDLALDAKVELALGLVNGAVAASFRLSAREVSVGLGSPVAVLRLASDDKPLALHADLVAGSAMIEYPDSFAAWLALELAALPGAAGAAARIVPVGRSGPTKAPPFSILLARFATAPLAAAGVRTGIDLSDLARPRVPAWLFREGTAQFENAGQYSELLDIAAGWLDNAAELLGASFAVNGAPAIKLEDGVLALTLPIKLSVAGMEATTGLKATCAVDDQGYLVLRGDSFACNLSKVQLAMTVTDPSIELGAIAALLLPPTLQAELTLDGSTPGECLRLVIPDDGVRPVLSVPASGGIEFVISRFALGSGGLTLDATVSKKKVTLDVPVLDKDFAVQEARDGLGEFHIVRGRLVSASLQAKVRLKVFDDADGVLTLRIVQDQDGLTMLAELDVGVGKTFHLRALYLQVEVASINLSLSYNASGNWSAKGGLTGSIKFSPEGPMLGRLEEYGALFDGTSVHFERMDLEHLGSAPITVMVTPRTFDVGSMFSVTWRGFVLQRPGDLQAFMGVRLLGDIAFKQRLPQMRVALTLGDIQIRQMDPGSLIPKISISSIGVDIALSGGFSFKGRIAEFDDAYEYGFGGEVELRSEALPATQALLKLTRPRSDPSKPAIAVYVATERNDSLGYGFFLRQVGMGVGIRQGLRGFSDDPANPPKPPKLNIAGRVERALKDPRGLPYPGHLSSWQVLDADERPQYLLAAYMLVTFGLFKRDVDHVLAASAVLALDDNLDLILGLNGWFVTSPDNTTEDEYIAHPAIKGALALSPREQVLYGRFMTLPGSKFGKTAALSQTTALLKLALDAVRLSVAVYADPRGALVEVGWPRNARFETTLGPANGWAEAGFRFGYYRGTQVIGLNLAVHAEISGGFSQDMGFANVSLSALARFELQAAFAGAVTTQGRYYLLAELTLSALLEIAAHVYKRIRISGWGFSFTVTLFDVSVSIGLAATASLQTALVPSGLGFRGSVDVHLRVAGFGISARVRIASSEGRVDEARNTINALVPPIAELINAGEGAHGVAPALALATAERTVAALRGSAPAAVAIAAGAAPEMPRRWRCYTLVVGKELRVVLFPDGENPGAGGGYPSQGELQPGQAAYQPRTHALVLGPHVKGAYRGLVGRAPSAAPPPGADDQPYPVSLVEQADDVMLSHEWLRRQQPDAPRALKVGDMLQNIAVHAFEPHQEVVDPRTIHPLAGDFDDPAVLANPSRRSTSFRKRYSSGGLATYDDHLRNAAETQRNDPAPEGAGGNSSAELLLQLLNLARDSGSAPGKEESGPQPGDTAYSPHLLASRLGLVLSFEYSAALEADLEQRGIAALLPQEGPYPVMFGYQTSAADWTGGRSARRFQIEPGYDFQGKGEVGLTWSVLRIDADGTVVRDGPENHDGIAAFRVSRLRDDRSGLPALPAVQVVPSWLKYARDGTTYYLRPQFQFHDSGLPTSGGAMLDYLVEAIADDGKGSTVLATQVMRVNYQAAATVFSVAQAQALLRIPADAGPLAGVNAAPYRVELTVQVDVDTRAAGAQGWLPDEAARQRLAARIEIWRYPVDAGVIGRYGQGHDGQVSVSWDERDAAGVALPQADQARQLTIADFADATDMMPPPLWTIEVLPPAQPAPGEQAKPGVALTCRATLEIRPGREDGDWDRLLGAGRNAAELHVRLNADPGAPTVGPQPATGLVRCRVALARAMPAGSIGAPPVIAPTEGTEVAALERLPLAAAFERTPEWLPTAQAVFGAETAARPFVGGAGADDIGLRLRGIVNHARASDHPFGPVVGYRIWAHDRYDADPAAGTTCLADFLVEPEALYRAFPPSVTVRQLAGADAGEVNWRFDTGPLRMPAAAAPADPLPAGCYAVQRLDGGNQASLHGALVALAGALSEDGRSARVHADEPMWPAAAPGAERLAELILRHPRTVDAFGWRLLEALGASATIWVASDDDRLGVETWEATLAAFDDTVVAVTFSRLQPGERPDRLPLALYGVRVFSRAHLAELLDLAGPGEPIDARLARPGSQLALALRLVAPLAPGVELTAKTVPRPWLDYVEALLDRVGGFVALPDDRHPVCLCAPMWELTKVPAQPGDGAKAQYPLVLPALHGQVHVFHTLDNGYARLLELSVEVVRRYDVVAPRAGRTVEPSACHQVRVWRTQALEAERYALQPDPATGAVTALVAVHSAQRLVLFRSDLDARVQFIEQKVELQREVAPQASAGWNAMFAGLWEQLDFSAYQRSWVEASLAPVPPLSSWTLDEVPSGGRAITHGYDSYRYEDLAPFYAHGVRVTTQAGVRHSGEAANQGAVPAPVEAMFTEGSGIGYTAPPVAWALDDDGRLELVFALVRGIDALPLRTRAHWIARDALWPVHGDADGQELEVPVLQLPDLRVRYVVLATTLAGPGPALRTELLHIVHGSSGIEARLLVGTVDKPGRVDAALVQLDEGADQGRLGVSCALQLAGAALDWLRSGLAADPPTVALALDVQRDGIHYRSDKERP
jgi:hypothetical protein